MAKKKKNYIIIPVKGYRSEVIKASSPEDAIEQFAFEMDTDMNIYFRAVLEDEVDSILDEERSQEHEDFVEDWMKDTLMEDFDIKDEWKAKDLAEWAYDRYCEGRGETEYECIEWAYENHYSDDGYGEDDEDDE